jgi:hypothetical protein
MRRIFAYYCRQSPDPGTLGSRKCKEGRGSMKRLLAVSLIGAELLTHGHTDAMAQMSEATKHIIWLSCANKIDGKDINHIFAIDLEQQKVLQFENRNMYYEMHDIRISEDAILFSYYTKGSHPFTQDEEFFRMVDKKALNNPLDAYVSTSMEINRRNLFMRVIKRYYNTMLDHYYTKCFVIDAITPLSRQF